MVVLAEKNLLAQNLIKNGVLVEKNLSVQNFISCYLACGFLFLQIFHLQNVTLIIMVWQK